ncbi:MAG: hypothetical protein UW43_C0001G0039 [Candidatus Yanofskybacteria bacterium GW2011_GWA1_44_21]|uniref:N-acetyltransferase domain-containing protein n=2 Tax=Candidatus Yanofskyibacteriota TaxID=1752733 RepID=A0A1F8H1J6_9BACT|nr:MAG: hypothetical protein UW14_C0006G0031 [Candidatus Yanofskybacteria bacterium GW2011_GWA2_44_10]KKT50874.1 MAG: hypothetical protein UW43_C0001G0039 [Candidatus Yanofskybacteria bacterium GW2011_GWA1_44_21]KKT90446.1 MAG: hypothetical protein UW90_C0001G0034 [Candidatus Yanofskybacteria bacterium GW2011_GWB1_45_11]OGN02295.1 MAG: hypothetical protein A2657_00915 [Candidatus Yanofskybacteria bacterium RIFCSPHIGHO2_01_FULL_44_110b]OGN14253.1 MAG: hypothetical protein A3C01_01505 [Candidatus
MEIRNVKKEDITEIRNIYSKSYIDEESGRPKDEDVDYFTKKVEDYVDQTKESLGSDYYYLVAENNTKVIGVIGTRKPHVRLLPLAKTDNSVELYSLFVLEKNLGVGKSLVNKIIEICRQKGYSEMMVLSANRWKESWPFYDKLGFERAGTITELSGRLSQVWTREL